MVRLHLKERGRSCENPNVPILDKDRWFEKGVKEDINSQSERSSLKRTGVLQHQQSATYNAIQRSLPKCFNLCNPSLCVCVPLSPLFPPLIAFINGHGRRLPLHDSGATGDYFLLKEGGSFSFPLLQSLYS